MKHRGCGWLIGGARFPGSRDAATDAKHTMRDAWVRERETIVKSTGLREAKQKDAISIGYALFSQRFDYIQQRAMMNRNRIFRMKVCEPAKAETQRTTRFFRFL